MPVGGGGVIEPSQAVVILNGGGSGALRRAIDAFVVSVLRVILRCCDVVVSESGAPGLPDQARREDLGAAVARSSQKINQVKSRSQEQKKALVDEVGVGKTRSR